MSLNPAELARELDDELDGPDPSLEKMADLVPPDDLADLTEALRAAKLWQRAEEDRVAIETVALERMAEIDDWVQRKTSPIKARLAWHAHALEGWARRMIGNRTKNKYEDVMNLRLSLRQAHRPHVDVRDEQAFIDWCLADRSGERTLAFTRIVPIEVIPTHVEIITEAIANGLGKSPTAVPIGDVQEREFLHEGEIVPGVVLVEQQRDKFSITIHEENA